MLAYGLDISKVSQENHRRFHGLDHEIRAFAGARIARIVHPPGQRIGEHRHDWPFLMIPIVGEYVERHDGDEASVAGASAVLHPAGLCHENCIGDHGMEAISIEFDADWIGESLPQLFERQPRLWAGGAVGGAARKLSRAWCDHSKSEDDVRRLTTTFLTHALQQKNEPPARSEWHNDLSALLQAGATPETAELASRLKLHPAWLARRYRECAGEGLHETIRRRRVERAIVLLRATAMTLAEVAAVVGFCDQSHMVRVFKSILGRTPTEVRTEQTALEMFMAHAIEQECP